MYVEIEESWEYQAYWYARELEEHEGEIESPNVEDEIERGVQHGNQVQK